MKLFATHPAILHSALAATVALVCGTFAYADCVDPNTCFGTGALDQHVSGDDNSAFGFQALGADVNGEAQTAIGSHAMSNSVLPPLGVGFCPGPVSTCGNTAVGAYSLNSITIGDINTGVGTGALARTTTGATNTALGYAALHSNTTGGSNIGIGFNALFSNTIGNLNIAIGDAAMQQSSTTSWNIAVGHVALLNNRNGQNNIAIGKSAMENAIAGNFNVALGDQAIGGDEFTDSSGSYNVAIGAGAFRRNANGNYNTAIGYQSMGSLGDDETTSPNLGSNNTAYGVRTLRSNESGASNTAVGANALHNNTIGNYNTANGNNSLRNLSSGIRNVAIGHSAGFNITTGSDNIIIGGDNTGRAADNGVIRIGRKANQQKTFIAGIQGVQTARIPASPVVIDVNGQLGTIQSSIVYKENVEAIGALSERVLALRPVKFQYKQASEDGTKPLQFGLIAEEVAEVFPELVIRGSDGEPESVIYHVLPTLLLNEVKKDRKTIDAQNARITALERQVAELAALVRSSQQ
jgi:hypothetical protein